MLMPDAHAGLFISYNSAGSRQGGGRTEVIHSFLNRYFPEPVSASPPIDLKTTQADGLTVSGVYNGSRRGESTFLKMAAVLGQVSVTADRNGLLTIEGMQSPRGGLKQWHEVGPLVYREVDGPDLIAFRRDANGVVTDLLPSAPIQMGQRVTGVANKKVLLPVLGLSLGLLALTLLLWPVAVIIRKRYGKPLFSTTIDRVLYLLSRLFCLLEIAFLALIVLPLSLADKNIAFIGDGINPWLTAAHALGWMSVVGLFVLTIAAVRFWRAPGPGWWARVHATLLWFASLLFLSFAWWAHLLTPSLRF